MAKRSPERLFRYLYLRLIRLKGQRKAVARGLAIGVFAGLSPLWGTHTLVALLVAIPLRASKLAAALAVWTTNPLTAPMVYYSEFKLGQWLLNSRVAWPAGADISIRGLIDASKGLLVTLTVGYLALGTVAALLTYALYMRAGHLFEARGRKKGVDPRKAVA